MWSKSTVAVVAMMFCSCASSQQLPAPPQEPAVIDSSARAVDSGMVLDAARLDKFMDEAEAGDGTAAFRLSLHFMSLEMSQKAEYWLLFAATRGHPTAQYNLWFDLKDRDDCKSRLEALAWIRSASLNGNESARKELKGFTEIVQSCL